MPFVPGYQKDSIAGWLDSEASGTITDSLRPLRSFTSLAPAAGHTTQKAHPCETGFCGV